MPSDPVFSYPLRIADLSPGRPHEFTLEPDAKQRAAIAADLGILALRKLRLTGRLVPAGRRDWRLVGDLGATVVQACVVTLAPVTTRIDEPLQRTYIAAMPDLPEGDEVEMPDDDTIEPLPAVLDLGEVLIEALALALPPYPRAENAEPVNQIFARPGTEPMRDEDAKPFAGLADLKKRLEGKSGD